MRLSYSGNTIGSFRSVDKKKLRFFKDIGVNVLGLAVDLDATEDDIKRFNDIFGEMDLQVGQIVKKWMGEQERICLISPDKNHEKKMMKNIEKSLKIGGKIGATALQFIAGSMHPEHIGAPHPDNHTQKALDMLIENTKKIVPIAEDSECMITIETTQWTIVNSVERMKEYVDRVDSPYMKIVFDPVNHMTYARIYESGRYIRCAIATLGDRIGTFHVKDVEVENWVLVCHINEAEMGKGLFDHEALIKASNQLEPWKLFILEHIRQHEKIKPAFDYIQGTANRIGHTWTDPHCTRKRWEKGLSQ